MTNAWGYVRLSQDSDTSIQKQKKSIREYAKDRGLNLQTTRNEGEGKSGFKTDREQFDLLREKIESAEIDAVITRDRARLSRDFDDRLSLILDFRKTGVEWHVIEAGGKLSLQDRQQAGMECLHAMMDDIKKRAEIERAKEVTAGRVADDDVYHGRPPFGFRFDDNGRRLEQDPEEWVQVEAILDGADQGLTVKEIRDKRKVTVSESTVRRVLERRESMYE
jgi:DNA invertase Pin-like site-specific DNA recombinase